MNVIERYESAAQSLVRSAPIVFQRAQGAELFDENGRGHIDFHSGGGTLNYGHNNLTMCSALIDYICKDHVLQTRDKTSVAKRDFIENFVGTILGPRGQSYKLLFTDPASGGAAEIALRIARRDRGRSGIVAFTNSSHGLTEAAPGARSRAALHRLSSREGGIVLLPYCGWLGPETDTMPYLRRALEDSARGPDRPAALILATVQVECGVQVAGVEWLKAVELLCREFDMLLILDDSQTGCGRTGAFFGFENAGLRPDMVVVSHAIAGGLPLSLLLLRPELDRWRLGEQAGIFQGDSLALVAASGLLSHWKNDALARRVARHQETIGNALATMVERFARHRLAARGDGMLWALDLKHPSSASVVSSWALEQGLVIEPAPFRDDVLLLLPPVTIEDEQLREGLTRLEAAVATFLNYVSPS